MWEFIKKILKYMVIVYVILWVANYVFNFSIIGNIRRLAMGYDIVWNDNNKAMKNIIGNITKDVAKNQDRDILAINLYFDYNYDYIMADTRYYIFIQDNEIDFEKTKNGLDSKRTEHYSIRKDKEEYYDKVMSYINTDRLESFERTIIKDEYGSITNPEYEESIMKITYQYIDEEGNLRNITEEYKFDNAYFLNFLEDMFRPYENEKVYENGLSRENICGVYFADGYSFRVVRNNTMVLPDERYVVDNGHSDYVYDLMHIETLETSEKDYDGNGYSIITNEDGNYRYYKVTIIPNEDEIKKYLDRVTCTGGLDEE